MEMDGRLKGYGLSGNTLKILAAFTMLIDHIGAVLLPEVTLLRIIGRIAFPLYGFMIAEGCTFTKNRLRYFLSIFGLGVACQAVYFLYSRDTEMGILIAFSLSVLVIYALQAFKEALFAAEGHRGRQCLTLVVFLLAVIGVRLFNRTFDMDYGFWGCMTPVLASVFRSPRQNPSPYFERLDRVAVHVLMLGIGLVILAFVYGKIQAYALLALPLLMLYSGKRGKWKMKSFFYIFYPAHLVLIEAVSMLLQK